LAIDPDASDDLLVRLGCADAYYLSDFLESACLLDHGRAAYLHLGDKGGEVLFPCVVRELPGLGIRDVTTPIGYGGPLAIGPRPPIERFYELYEEWCAENGIVATFIRFHPLFANHEYASPRFHQEPVAGSVAWRLDGDLLAEMHPHHRRLVRKAQSAGVRVETLLGSRNLESFAALYAQTMERVGASRYYSFPGVYWEALADRMDDRLVLLQADLGGTPLGSVICMATPPWLHYHLGATAEEGRLLGANHLLLYAAARLGQKRQLELFHLGSGFGGGGGGLLEFKRRFSPGPLVEQRFGKAVHDTERYLALTGATTVSYKGFFPAYRSPEGGHGEAE
jgi:hypothetical protein